MNSQLSSIGSAIQVSASDFIYFHSMCMRAAKALIMRLHKGGISSGSAPFVRLKTTFRDINIEDLSCFIEFIKHFEEKR